MISVKKIQEKYQSGERDFIKADLRQANFRGLDLSFINLSGANLEGANLEGAILKEVNLQEANLNKTNFNRANLQGANLSQSNILFSSFIHADLRGVNLSKSNLDASTLKKANLQGANLSQTWLCGADLEKAILTEAYYDNQTHFDQNFNILEAKCQMKTTITVEESMNQLIHLTQFIQGYLGKSLTLKLLTLSRPNLDEFNIFQVIDGQINCLVPRENFLSILEENGFKIWLNNFIEAGSQIIRNLPDLIENKKIISSFPLLIKAKKTEVFSKKISLVKDKNTELFDEF